MDLGTVETVAQVQVHAQERLALQFHHLVGHTVAVDVDEIDDRARNAEAGTAAGIDSAVVARRNRATQVHAVGRRVLQPYLIDADLGPEAAKEACYVLYNAIVKADDVLLFPGNGVPSYRLPQPISIVELHRKGLGAVGNVPLNEVR